MSSIKNDETSVKKDQPEPDLENQIQQENTNKPNDESNKDTHLESPKFNEGDQVDVNYKGHGRWCHGEIIRINTDGSYHIKSYEDGFFYDEPEDRIRIHKIQPKRKFKEDDEIEFDYNGRGRWFPGKIFLVNHRGTYHIKCDDGDERRNVEEKNIRAKSNEKEKEKENDNISDLSDDIVTVKEEKKENWEDCLREFDPSDSSVTGVQRQKRPEFKVEPGETPPNDNIHPYKESRQKYIQDNNLTNEIKELGISNPKEEDFYCYHKKLFDKISNNSGRITINQFNNLLQNEFEYNNNYSEPGKITINNIVLDNYVRDHINRLGYTQYISFLDYFSVAKHMNFIYENNNDKLLELSKKLTDRKLEHETLRNKEDNLRTKEYELDIIEKQRDIDVRKQMLTINDNIKIYTPDKYGKSCCNFILNITKQNVIDDFDKIYETIINLPSLNSYEKNIILIRFHSILTYCTKNYNSVSKLYNTTQTFLIACSIINPALLSINSNKNNAHYDTIFWTVWISQLLVSLITGYVGLFKWDKKYFLFNAYKTKINQEIWRFIGLSGKNYKSEKANSYDHSYHLSVFLNRLESFYCQLKISEFEIENTKEEDSNNSDNTASNGNGNGNGKTVNVKQDAINLMKSRQNNQQLQSENSDLKVMRNEIEDENRRLQTRLRRAEREYR